MDNASKAIIVAGCAMLFVFAASAAVYLYGSVFSYMDYVTKMTNIDYRTERASNLPY